MGTLFLVIVLAIDLAAYAFFLNQGSPQELVNRVCTGVFFIALALQILIDWRLKKEFRVFYLVVPVNKALDQNVVIASIIALMSLGTYMVVVQ